MTDSTVTMPYKWLQDEHVEWIGEKLGLHAVSVSRKLAESFYEQNEDLLEEEGGEGAQISLQIVSICTHRKYDTRFPVHPVACVGNTLTLLCNQILVIGYLPFQVSPAFKAKIFKAAEDFYKSKVAHRPHFRASGEATAQVA